MGASLTQETMTPSAFRLHNQSRNAKRHLLRLTLLSTTLVAPGVGQAPKQGAASAKGTCGVAHSGNGDTIIIKNCGIGAEQGEKIIVLLNKVLASGDQHAVTLQLDHLLSTLSQPLQSQNNSGGINVEQGTIGPNSPIVNSPITIGDLKKTIAQEQVPGLVQFLSSAPTKLRVVIGVDQYSGSHPFPSDFYDLLNKSGWPMRFEGLGNVQVFSDPRKMHPKAAVSIFGETPPEGEPKSLKAPDPRFYICAVLQNLNVPCELHHSKELSQDVVSIWFFDGFTK